MSDHENEARGETPRRVFELYVDQVASEADALDEALIVRLRWFQDDIETASRKINDDPGAIVQVIHGLSTMMQQIDTAAGAAEGARRQIPVARRWALLIPEDGNGHREQ